ncbi:hypothetical protein, partial [Hoeflea sp.]|uniref:hypothetical protein n=1 Tax=Hoeflea sp. TaxID=1940281 RepID=UPI0019891435
IENLRPGQSDETPTGATATIWISKLPDVMILDSEECYVEGTIHGPLGWTAAWVSTRSGRKASADTAAVSTDVSRRNAVALKVLGQSFGNATRADRAMEGRYSVVARGCRSGSPMLLQATSGSVTESWNHWLDSDDFDGMQSPTNSGYGRVLVTAYASDRMDRIRGVTGSRITGTRTQASGATSFTVNANAGVLVGVPTSSINPAWLRVSTRGTPVAYSVTWDSATALFTVTTATAAGAATTWDYVVEPVL